MWAELHLGVRIDLFIVLFSEAWPCSWSCSVKFWSSQLLDSQDLAPYMVGRQYMEPPARCAIKAGPGMVVMNKKTMLLHLSNRIKGSQQRLTGTYLQGVATIRPGSTQLQRRPTNVCGVQARG